MTLNLDNRNWTSSHIKYFAYTTCEWYGSPCIMILCASGTKDSYYWLPEFNTIRKRPTIGYRFSSVEEAITQAKNARINPFGKCPGGPIRNLNKDEIKITAVQFTTVMTAVNLGYVT